MSTQLNHRIIGKGKPIIILHGLFGMLDNWLTMARRLEAAGYMSILIDQRDHGRSKHTYDFNYSLLAQDLYDFMESHSIHQAIILGHSMGGKAAMQFAAEHESLIEKLIVVDIGPGGYRGGHGDIFDALFSVNLDSIQSRNEAEAQLAVKIKDPEVVQFLMKNLSRTPEGSYTWKMNLALLYEKYEQILAPVNLSSPCMVETLFIRGRKSDYIRDEDFADILTKFPNAGIYTIEEAGHWVHADRPDELFNRIIDFIDT
jgi:pimeloyl-ACP methyl ester carboxylesterase